MAALWGGGAGHAGAGGTLPLRGAPESVVGNDLSSTQYLLAEDLRLASVDAETILEAEELLGTMQDYLDSSVISIIEDFSSLTEQTKGRMDAENELSLLTAITEILDSTDDESLSPFDTIPDSEFLTSPRERENSSFQRFLSLSVTPPEQDFHTIEDFQESRIRTIVTEKVETSTASLPFTPTQNCPNDLAPSKKPSSKAPRGDQRLFRHKEWELSVSQRSDGEEEEEEETATGHDKGFVAGPKEIPVVSATREVEMDLATSDGPYVIAPESISLSELVRSMHTYCLPTFTVCLSAESQPLAEELLAPPVVMGVPDGEKSMENLVVQQNMEAELPCRTDHTNCTTGHMDREPVYLAPALKEVLPVNDTKFEGLDRDLALGGQAEVTGKATLQVVKNAHPVAEKVAQRSARDQESRSQPDSIAPITVKLSVSEKGQRCRRTKKNKSKSNKERLWHKESVACKLPFASVQKRSWKNPSDITLSSGLDVVFPAKQLEKPGRPDQDGPLPGHTSPTEERMDTEELLRSETKQGLSSPMLSEALPPTEEHLSTEHQQCVDPKPGSAEQVNVQGLSMGSQPTSLDNEMVCSEASELLFSSTPGPAGQPPSTTTEKVSLPPKEAKPKPLSLTEYRQRRQQWRPCDGSAKSITEKQNASKWPSLPELPTELADLPCLVVPPPTTKVAVPTLAKEPEKPAVSSTPFAPDDKASAAPPSMPAHSSSPATIVPPSFPLGCVSTAPLATPVPAASTLPNKVGAFPLVGAQVPPTLPPPYLHLNPRAFLSASPSSYILGSPPVPSWSHFAPLPTGYQNLPPPPPPATEVCPPVFHTIPPVPPPTWPPPPVSLPPFAPGLPFSSVEWAPGPQPSYWPGIPVPPPMLAIPYMDQGAHVQSSPVGTFPASLPEGALGQQSTAVPLEPSCFQAKCSSVPEKFSLPSYHAQVPSSVRSGSRRASDPRRQMQPSAAESKAEVTLGNFQALGKSLPPPTAEILGKVALTQLTKKSSSPVSLSEPHSVPPSQQAMESTGAQKFLEEPSFLPAVPSVGETLALPGPVESVMPAVAPSSKEVSSASCPQEEGCSPLPAALVPEKLTVPTATERDVNEAAPTVPSALASAAPQKVAETGQLAKNLSQTWKHQPLISVAQHSCNKDIVQAFIDEIGIEASDLSSLLEQFEKIAAKKEASSMAKSREHVAARNDGSEVQQEKKTLDRLQAPELANVAGLTPPATPPHHLWKPLAAVSLLGKAGTPKGARLVKSLSKPHRKTLAPIHVGSGEHDYCQLSAAQPKEGSRWNVKHNLDITIKPIMTLNKQVPEQPGPSQTPVAVRLDAVSTLSRSSGYQNPKEVSSPIDAGRGQIQALSPAATSPSSPSSQLFLPESSFKSSHTEPLDHRTSTPKRGSDDPCSVLLSPAASPCRDAEEPTSQQPQEVLQKRLASKRSLRCYRSRQKSTSPQKGRWRGRQNRASRSFSSSSDGDSNSSSSSSRSRSRSHSQSPPSKRWRRYHSRRSSSSCDSSWSRSRSRSRASSCSSYESRSSSRSPSLHRSSSCRRRYDSSSSHDRYQRQKIRYKESAIEERRVVFIGKIPSRMTRSELQHRFSVFGEIEDCTLHFREQGDNYGFVTYRYAEEAFAAIEGGNALRRPDEQPFDLCFGGRRQFCKRNYADLDSNREDFEPASAKSKFDSLDFDTLLKQAQRSLRR